MNKKSYITTGSFLVPFSMNPPPFPDYDRNTSVSYTHLDVYKRQLQDQ